jgi:hypothetical protein
VRIGAGVKEDHGGASSLFSCSDGGKLEVRRQRKKKEWGKKRKLPPFPYLYCGAVFMGTVVVLHYPDRFGRHRHVVARRGAVVPVTMPLG